VPKPSPRAGSSPAQIKLSGVDERKQQCPWQEIAKPRGIFISQPAKWKSSPASLPVNCRDHVPATAFNGIICKQGMAQAAKIAHDYDPRKCAA
jgi:hypothetical protein